MIKIMQIKREKYLNRLVIRMHNGMVKVITGLRRSGKSYLLNEIFYEYLLSKDIDSNHIIKFAFDSADDLEKIGEDFFDIDSNNKKVDPRKFMVYIRGKITDDGMYYLLLDEIQNLGSFESVLNGYLRKNNIDIYVTGSNSKFLSSDVLTEFEGRGDEIHVFPLSFSEFCPTFTGSTEQAYEAYSMFGGLPTLASMLTEEQRSDYLKSLIKKVYLKDIIKRNNIKNDSNISELLNVLSSGMSSYISPSKLESTFKSAKKVSLSRTTIDTYIDYFMDSFLLSKAIKFDIKGRKYINTPYKIYFEDIGLRNAIIDFRQYEPTHIMENIIYNELRYRGFNVDVGIVETREKEDGKDIRKYYEVDFIATTGSKKYYIQSPFDIKDDNKWIQETNSYNKINDSFKKIIIVKNPIIKRQNEKGYLIMNIFDFLLKDNSLEL